MVDTITVYRGYTHAAISLLRSSPAAQTVGRYLRRNLIENEYIPEHNECRNGRWMKVFGHWEPKYQYYFYDERLQKLNVPIAFVNDIIHMLKQCGYNVVEDKLNDYPLREIDVKMKPNFNDQDHQVELIKKCSEKTPGMKGLAMQTGKGKTYSAIKSWINLGYAGIVVVGKLVDQWIESVREFTDCDPDYIYKLQEFNSLALLAHNPDYKPKFFVASLRTMQIFCDGKEGYDLLPWNFTQFFSTYGIGVKIVDECHQAFNATTLMDLKTNVPYNLYCSATFTQSSRAARDIFNRIFPRHIQYGLNAYDKYISVVWINYSGEVLEKRCMKSRGYMHAKYEKELMISERKMNTHINELFVPLIDAYYVNKYKPGYKALIFCTGIDFVEAMVVKLKRLYPQYKIISYLGGDNMSVLKDADIVVSTTGKAGTGLDLKGLILSINSVSSGAEVMCKQMFGRLRKRDDVELVYCDLCDTNIAACVRHGAERKELLKSMCSKFYEYNGIHDITPQTGEVPSATISSL